MSDDNGSDLFENYPQETIQFQLGMLKGRHRFVAIRVYAIAYVAELRLSCSIAAWAARVRKEERLKPRRFLPLIIADPGKLLTIFTRP